MLLALSFSIGAVIFAAFLLVSLFQFVGPEIVMQDYRRCSGNWYEAELLNCSAGLMAIPQQPVNTYSNLAYLGAGFFVAVLVNTPASFVFAFAMTYLCVGSALYHAMSTRWSGMLDVTAIYVVFSTLTVYAGAVLFRSPAWLTPLLMFIVSGAIAYALSPKYHRNMRLIIAIFLGGAYVLLLLKMWISGLWAPWPFLVTSLAAFLLAFLFWQMDRARTFPVPRWGHGLWHILTAMASGFVFYTIHLVDL